MIYARNMILYNIPVHQKHDLELQSDRLFLSDIVDQRSNTVAKPYGHLVTIFEVHRGFSDKTDTSGSSSDDNCTGFECSALGEEGNCLANREDLFTGSL